MVASGASPAQAPSLPTAPPPSRCHHGAALPGTTAPGVGAPGVQLQQVHPGRAPPPCAASAAEPPPAPPSTPWPSRTPARPRRRQRHGRHARRPNPLGRRPRSTRSPACRRQRNGVTPPSMQTPPTATTTAMATTTRARRAPPPACRARWPVPMSRARLGCGRRRWTAKLPPSPRLGGRGVSTRPSGVGAALRLARVRSRSKASMAWPVGLPGRVG